MTNKADPASADCAFYPNGTTDGILCAGEVRTDWGEVGDGSVAPVEYCEAHRLDEHGNLPRKSSITYTLVCDICQAAATYRDTPPSGWVSLPVVPWLKRWIPNVLDHGFTNPDIKLDACPTCIEKGRRP